MQKGENQYFLYCCIVQSKYTSDLARKHVVLIFYYVVWTSNSINMPSLQFRKTCASCVIAKKPRNFRNIFSFCPIFPKILFWEQMLFFYNLKKRKSSIIWDQNELCKLYSCPETSLQILGLFVQKAKKYHFGISFS